ncbi:MAG: hypothetical protein ACODAC_12495 [Pseudomonadota bacterium]
MPSPSTAKSMLDRVLEPLPGWLLLGAGLALVAAVVLTPAWLDYHKLAWQRQVLTAQSEHLAAQTERYDRFHLALVEDDPVVLERLAYVELGLKPVNKTPLLPNAPRSSHHHFAAHGDAGERTRPAPIPPPAATTGSIDDWLLRPLPRVGHDLPPYQPPRTRLTRLATGDSRFVLLAAAIACLSAGLWPGMWGNGTARPDE